MDIVKSDGMSVLSKKKKADILFALSPPDSIDGFIDSMFSPNALVTLERAMEKTVMSDLADQLSSPLSHSEDGKDDLLRGSACSYGTSRPRHLRLRNQGHPYETSRLHHLKQRSQTHPNDTSFECPLCERCFPNDDALQQHKLGKHARKTELLCRQCGFVAKDQTELDGHFKKHSHACKYCGETFATAQKVRKHLRSHVLHRCSCCKFSSVHREAVNQHESDTHGLLDGPCPKEFPILTTMDRCKNVSLAEDADYDICNGPSEMLWLRSNDMVILPETIKTMLANFPSAESLTIVNQ